MPMLLAGSGNGVQGQTWLGVVAMAISSTGESGFVRGGHLPRCQAAAVGFTTVLGSSLGLHLTGLGKDEVQQPCPVPACPFLFILCLDMHYAGSSDATALS